MFSKAMDYSLRILCWRSLRPGSLVGKKRAPGYGVELVVVCCRWVFFL